jgi:hypothetical protein
MNLQDVEGFCAANNVEFMEVGSEDKLGAGMLFHWTRPGSPPDDECVHLTFQALEETTPEQLLKSVVNGRDVRHVTRIVGYYSRTENWNKSKLGELKDRHKGRYSVQASEAAAAKE